MLKIFLNKNKETSINILERRVLKLMMVGFIKKNESELCKTVTLFKVFKDLFCGFESIRENNKIKVIDVNKEKIENRVWELKKLNTPTDLFNDYYSNLYVKKSIIYSVTLFDKMMKLILKIVLLNSKYFFLNNIKYNYTLLKFCDKQMKLVNSILLFCLLCDINIPYYCFHSDLSIAGNCRMCLVQLDTSLKPIASCAVSIGINSTIYTNTKLIKKAREGVLEFLLINHPLDCPICDQGGECDLQEQFITYGNDRGRSLKNMI